MFSSIGHLPEPRGEVTTSQPPTATSDGERTTYTLTRHTAVKGLTSQSKLVLFAKQFSWVKEGGWGYTWIQQSFPEPYKYTYT